MDNGTVDTARFFDPRYLASHFHMRKGDTVADFGAGAGYYVPLFADAVGTDGRVLACEIQKPLIEKLGSLARKHGYENVDILWCDIEQPQGIPVLDEVVDVGVMVNTLHQCEQKPSAITEARRTIRTGGTLHIVDYDDKDNVVMPKTCPITHKDDVIAWCESSGFMLERDEKAGDYHYRLAFRAIWN